jgi:uncharacterized repeat protein (TIGR02543 family)
LELAKGLKTHQSRAFSALILSLTLGASFTYLPNAAAEDPYNIQWDDNGATTPSSGGSTSAEFDGLTYGPFAVPSPQPKRSGYLFKGWFTSKSLGGCSAADGRIYDDGLGSCPKTVNESTRTLTLFANWEVADSSLSSLVIEDNSTDPASPVNLSSEFAGGTKSYTASVANTVSSITITPTVAQANATTVQYLGATGTIPFIGELSVGPNVIRTVVTAADGITVSTYSVTVTRISDIATLSALAISYGTLNTPFNSETPDYSLSVPYSVSSITITPTVTQPNATTVQYLGGTGTTASTLFTGALPVGTNVIRTVVTALDGTTKKAYTVTVTRAAASSVNTLLNLALSSGTLSTQFASGTATYQVSVPYSVSSMTITPTVTQANATTVQYLGATGTTAFTGALTVSANVIRIVVTPENGGTKKTYTVTVTRAAASSVNTLSALAISSGTLAPTFESGTATYQVSVPYSVSSMTITPTVTQANATTVQYLGATGTTPFTGSLIVGANVIRTVVTPENGSATQTYTVTVTRVEAVTYNIIWDNQGADVRVSSGGSSNFTTGSAIATIPTTAPQKTGYTFVGWFTSATSGSQVTNSSYTPASPYGNLTFYARWAVDEASVKAAAAAVAKAAAEAAAAQREAEKQSARADVTAKLQNAKDLTPEIFAKAEIPGVTTKNIAAVQAELMAMPETARTDINQILKVAHKYEVVGNIGSDQIKTMLPNSFVEIGLIPAESKNKVALVAAIRKLPEASRDTYAEIKAAIDAEAARIKSRNDRLAAIVSRNSSKNSIQNSTGQKNG